MLFSARELDREIGGRPVVRLEHAGNMSLGHPHFIQADVLPGRGMNLISAKAVPRRGGLFDLLYTLPLETLEETMNGSGEDRYGIQSCFYGAAVLYPWANRIRGTYLPGTERIETDVMGRTLSLPANWRGTSAGAQPCAIHGLLLDRAMDRVETEGGDEQAKVTAVSDAGDFGGQWLSRSRLTIAVYLAETRLGVRATAENTGSEDLPAAFGWHPYFKLPGDRHQIRLHVPAARRALVNNDDDQFPTGKTAPVVGTPYDFSSPDGNRLHDLFLNDCFFELGRNAEGHTIIELIDRSSDLGVRITALSPEINAVQVYAPENRDFVSVEPQFNLPDPFGPVWNGANTGMVVLKPGESVTYAAQVELFEPAPIAP